ncbi:hypothetical protein NG895_16550 [Aeoliella sp. ICT_H6.2]|uniref:Uncharacterized protein n=1 Tax=Aeoliella straminimaris TaxID=2954799 RepID=A0A9X2JIB0_9BACT|nr:hypothetical protein [Aeoliella straminimaris]MCO6045523.1 hypothetical protein [Aeoliella straminimaris]
MAAQHVLEGTIEASCPDDTPLRVWAMPVVTTESGHLVPPTKAEILAAASSGDVGTRSTSRKFSLAVDGQGPYCVFAFADLNDNGCWDPATPEPFGWFATEAAGSYAPVKASDRSSVALNFSLKAPRPIPTESQAIEGGSVTQIKGYTVLQLTGDAQQRGFAHGKLMADPIVDFFRFYILEDKMQSARGYEASFAKFLHSNFSYPPEFVTECEAVIEGMKASGADLQVPELGREFSLTDLYAINAYIETRAMRTSCTQFAAWGERTAGTDVDGGMITGRNMDGEIDLRRVTVSHFLLMAVDPTEPGQKRYVSMMWPGFVATISGINEDGFYTMENAGLTGPGPVVDQMVPFSWAMRESLAKLGGDATPESVQSLVDSFDNSAGGSCGPGCITLFAVPYKGQETPAFILEGDRFGDQIRRAEQAEPYVPQALVASNHHRAYGVNASRPGQVFDKTPSFSSLWRYEAGMNKLDAWYRVGRAIGTDEMQQLLQTVAHGTTEYAIITRPNQREVDVAVASMKSEPWDAPYRGWTTFAFDELFAAPRVASDSPATGQ